MAKLLKETSGRAVNEQTGEVVKSTTFKVGTRYRFLSVWYDKAGFVWKRIMVREHVWDIIG